MTAASTRTELGAFLRAARARLAPAELGLAATGRRRTPGLRREEVAAASGVGVSWYSWVEQGRVSASRAVLDAVSATLRLTPDEHAHVLALGGFAAEPITEDGDEVVELLASWPSAPALALDHHFGVLAGNTPSRLLWPDLAPGENLLLRLAQLPGYEQPLYELLLRFRALAQPDDNGVRQVLDELPRLRPDLAHLWRCRAVRRSSSWPVDIEEASTTLHLRCTMLRPHGDDLRTILLGTPRDPATHTWFATHPSLRSS
ncbi:transcriptional regulator with XRE-family HTH domain [Saccharopolyspora lacisalsi]|uniref:Transcriptional regulator with XRE-family HTH domain n=1 Tax=Halosaccharopolyspora lacisalsi TaxID=1000566 RepID=A0A839DWD9_9PSEU|nr:helix-turn-helix domain-containing protein [Halosaccharopolyspora lacisalsi]MBA8823767.1 transcriptional regulator with XRE-family HTH domain [Halosaccharopolyspora lacisalsi]